MFYHAFIVSYINTKPTPSPSSCFESVIVDNLGPFKQTVRGNQHIIVAIDSIDSSPVLVFLNVMVFTDSEAYEEDEY